MFFAEPLTKDNSYCFLGGNCSLYKVQKILPIIKFIYCNAMSQWNAQESCTAKTICKLPNSSKSY